MCLRAALAVSMPPTAALSGYPRWRLGPSLGRLQAGRTSARSSHAKGARGPYRQPGSLPRL